MKTATGNHPDTTGSYLRPLLFVNKIFPLKPCTVLDAYKRMKRSPLYKKKKKHKDQFI